MRIGTSLQHSHLGVGHAGFTVVDQARQIDLAFLCDQHARVIRKADGHRASRPRLYGVTHFQYVTRRQLDGQLSRLIQPMDIPMHQHSFCSGVALP